MIVVSIFILLISVISFIISILYFFNKGFLFNNAYIYASKTKKASLNKKPYYIQSGGIFFMMGIIFLLNALDALFKTAWIIYLVLFITILALIYAAISTHMINKKIKDKS